MQGFAVTLGIIENMSTSLEQQVILITGASTGIGAALAQELAQQFRGICLVLAARSKDKMLQVAAECEKLGAEVLVVPTDISDASQVEHLASLAFEHFGKVDALINNAGYGEMGPIELLSPEAAKEQFAVNFHGPLTLIQALVPIMRKQGAGKILNISSLGGRIAFPMAGLYSCSKFALEALSDVLRMELRAFNIQVVVIEPGPVVTDFFAVVNQKVEGAFPEAEQTPYQAAVKKLLSLKKQTELLGWTPQKVAKVMIKALVAKHPRPRYIAATGGNILIFLMTKILPTWARDLFWKRFYGIDKVEKEWLSREGF